jgi:hypothetical protein
LGAALACAVLSGLAEGFLRLFTPSEFDAYMGEQSLRAGIYRPDPDFCVAYRSWEEFREDNATRLAAYLPFDIRMESGKLWAFFGNSFVHAPGMLADHARAVVHDRCIFNLGRNEELYLRLAQIRLLLEHGLSPERIFITLMPVDLISLGRQPLNTIRVTAKGAIAYEPRLPTGWAGSLVRHSRLAWCAWLRAGEQVGDPGFRLADLNHAVEPTLIRDLSWLFGNLARVTREHHVSVTIVLIPNYEQIFGQAGFAFQDTLGPILKKQGFDVLDPRDTFCCHSDHPALFVPDKHFSPLGNQLLVGALLDHIRRKQLAQAGAGVPSQ